jgi:hypothetical protein
MNMITNKIASAETISGTTAPYVPSRARHQSSVIQSYLAALAVKRHTPLYVRRAAPVNYSVAWVLLGRQIARYTYMRANPIWATGTLHYKKKRTAPPLRRSSFFYASDQII